VINRPCSIPILFPFDANRAPWYTQLVRHGRIAQLGERFPYKEEVTGSSPVSPTYHLGTPQFKADRRCRAGHRRALERRAFERHA
jgi:hypothetical protein